MKTNRDVWHTRHRAGEDVVRWILDGTLVKARIDSTATATPIPLATGGRRCGKSVLIGMKTMGGETAAAWRASLEDLSARPA